MVCKLTEQLYSNGFSAENLEILLVLNFVPSLDPDQWVFNRNWSKFEKI